MNPAYADFVNRLFVKRSIGVEGMLHAAVGMSGETGEVLDITKKIWANNHPLSPQKRAKIVEELGDSLFYHQAMCNLLGITFADVLNGNMAKLNARYPDGYSDQASIARADVKTDDPADWTQLAGD